MIAASEYFEFNCLNKIDTINNLQSISTSFGKKTGRWRQKEFSKPLKKMLSRR